MRDSTNFEFYGRSFNGSEMRMKYQGPVRGLTNVFQGIQHIINGRSLPYNQNDMSDRNLPYNQNDMDGRSLPYN